MSLEEARRSIRRSMGLLPPEPVTWGSLPFRRKLVTVLRWIAVLPAAIAGSWAAWWLMAFFWRLAQLWGGIDPAGTFGRITSEIVTGPVLGACFVLAGAKVAPFAQRITGYVLTGIGLLILGAMLYAAILAQDYWAILSGACAVLGAGAAAISIAKGEQNLR